MVLMYSYIVGFVIFIRNDLIDYINIVAHILNVCPTYSNCAYQFGSFVLAVHVVHHNGYFPYNTVFIVHVSIHTWQVNILTKIGKLHLYTDIYIKFIYIFAEGNSFLFKRIEK